MPQWKQYSGIWTPTQQAQAIAAGTWPGIVTQQLYSWGYNPDGALGVNDQISYSSPVQVGSVADSYASLGRNGADAYGSFWAIKGSATLWAAGSNGFGTLGLGDAVARSSPTQVGALTNWAKVSGHTYATAALKTDGTLWGWGLNSAGNIGDGTKVNRNSPVQVGTGTDWADFACIQRSNRGVVIAVKTNGTLWSWGRNDTGLLGNSNKIYRSSPVQVGALTNWSKVHGEHDNVTALKTDGTLWSWGMNNSGQLGQNNIIYRSSPVQIGALTTWDTLHCSVFAADNTGQLYGWGSTQYGELGINESGATLIYSSPVMVGSPNQWPKVYRNPNPSGSYRTSIWVGTDGIYTCGNQGQGGGGEGVTTPNRSSPVQVLSATNFSAELSDINLDNNNAKWAIVGTRT